MTALNAQRIFGVLWLISIAVFLYISSNMPSDYSSMPGNPFGALLGGLFIVGVLSFLIMFMATIVYSINLKKEKKTKMELDKKKAAFFSTQLSLSPWFYVSLVLLIILVYLLGKKSIAPQAPPNIIIQPPEQQVPVIIQQPVAPRMKIENTNCYYIGDQLRCNTYSF